MAFTRNKIFAVEKKSWQFIKICKLLNVVLKQKLRRHLLKFINNTVVILIYKRVLAGIFIKYIFMFLDGMNTHLKFITYGYSHTKSEILSAVFVHDSGRA